jgi:hypothetical protein
MRCRQFHYRNRLKRLTENGVISRSRDKSVLAATKVKDGAKEMLEIHDGIGPKDLL